MHVEISKVTTEGKDMEYTTAQLIRVQNFLQAKVRQERRDRKERAIQKEIPVERDLANPELNALAEKN